jgi:hypothetical protein
MFEEAERRIVECMSPSERAAFQNGCQIVDWLMAIAGDPTLPKATRDDARAKLRACAHRQPGQTVQDVIGPVQ